MNKRRSGFALPTVVISAVVLFSILAGAVGLITTTRVALEDQYYRQLAAEAAESGQQHASMCLSQTDYIAPWTTNSLRPNTDCTGAPITVPGAPSPLLASSSDVEITYSVPPPDTTNGGQYATIDGIVRKRGASNNRTVKTYVSKTRAQLAMFVAPKSIVVGGFTQAFNAYDRGSFVSVVDQLGVARVWGFNNQFQLGTGNSNAPVTSPTVYPLSIPIKTAFADDGLAYSAHFITETGELYGTGQSNMSSYNDGAPELSGRFGAGADPVGTCTYGSCRLPTKLKLPAGETAMHVALGSITAVVSNSGKVYTVGNCKQQTLGWACDPEYRPPSWPSTNPTNPGVYSDPVLLSTIDTSTTKATSNLLTSSSALIRMEDGSVYGWGINNQGALGFGKSNTTQVTPRKLYMSNDETNKKFGAPGQPKAMQIAYNGESTWILDNNGDVWHTGHTYCGEGAVMPPGGTACQSWAMDQNSAGLTGYFGKMTLPNGNTTKAKRIMGVLSNFAILGVDNQLYLYGTNNQYPMGKTSPAISWTGEKFPLPAGVTVADFTITGGVRDGDTTNSRDNNSNNVYVIGSDGKVYASGSNAYCQLGLGGTGTCSANGIANTTPMQTFDGTVLKAVPTSGANVGIWSARGYVLIRGSDGRLFSLGNNKDGQLGDGTVGEANNSGTPRARKWINTAQVVYF